MHFSLWLKCINYSAASKYGEYCRLDIQCTRSDGNAHCNMDLNVCRCLPRFKPQSYNDGSGKPWCVGEL